MFSIAQIPVLVNVYKQENYHSMFEMLFIIHTLFAFDLLVQNLNHDTEC